MPTSNPIDILLEHDKWASRQIFLACEKLTDAQFDQKFRIGPGSLRATMTHIIGAINAWADTLAEQSLRLRIEEDGLRRSAAQLLERFEEATSEFMALARKHPLDEIVKRKRGDKEYSYTRAAVIAHVATHGMHHRAQCLNMLRQLGVSPLPPSSVAEWAWKVDFPQ